MVHIFLTGQPGVGKSTLIQKVLTKFKASVRIQGFYTGEVRSGGERIGFDVTTLPESLNGPLSRVGSAKKGDPVVGKYVVDLASFETLGLPTLEPREGVQLYILDEIGKMELKSAKFFPAVERLLNHAGSVVFGTVPVPSYGHKVAEVESVKAREDVHVIKVTRDNRDSLVDLLHAALTALMQNKREEVYALLGEFVVGAPANDGSGKGGGASGSRAQDKPTAAPLSNKKAKTTDRIVLDSLPQPAGPLMGDEPDRRVLLLGESSSPASIPDQGYEAYSERSFWSLVSPSSGYGLEALTLMKTKGVVVWDVVQDVHLPKHFEVTGAAGKKSKKGASGGAAHDLEGLLQKHPSIKRIVFNGTGAASAFRKYFPSLATKYECIILPSSSRANTSVTLAEKQSQWKEALGL